MEMKANDRSSSQDWVNKVKILYSTSVTLFSLHLWDEVVRHQLVLCLYFFPLTAPHSFFFLVFEIENPLAVVLFIYLFIF